ncbi:hypothetical protein RYQ61_05530 [Streptococcus intermedius]|uniref:hypothetical protein n=1 Tax=Streptococcus intermedius TaxID=1338 RepID=UPI0029426236|nr:hypothetical protein [Streptococcus intermedius]WOI90491.1 hypothetical protein RYQ61_05530 [Streptococcus intermedius]
MKQTIFNASLEESMNLVTDKYIQTAMEDINEKGYWRKIIGGLTTLFFMFLMYWLGVAVDTLHVRFYFLKVSVWMAILLGLGVLFFVIYIKDILKIKNNRVLSYYYYNKVMFLLMISFCLQTVILAISGSGLFFGNFLSSMVFTFIYGLVFLDRYQWFKTSTLEALYGQKEFQNPLARFLEYFTVFAKKYGGIIVLLLIVLRWIFPIDRHNDLVRAMGLVFYSFFMLIGVYFIIALGADNFQGYYIKKYMEKYRELSGYTVEEWYGPRSKKAKENK